VKDERPGNQMTLCLSATILTRVYKRDDLSCPIKWEGGVNLLIIGYWVQKRPAVATTGGSEKQTLRSKQDQKKTWEVRSSSTGDRVLQSTTG